MLTYSTNHPTVCLLYGNADVVVGPLGLTPEVQERDPGHIRQGSAEEAQAVPLLLTEQPFL